MGAGRAQGPRSTVPRREVHSLVRGLRTKAAIAVALICGRYVAHATIANSFGIQPPVPSIFADSTKS